MKVYVDGACLRNGQPGASAGVGVFWGNGHPLNISEVVDGEKHTNQIAEIQAATAAIGIAYQKGFDNLEIYTDSKYVFNGATDWINNKWKVNGWRNARGGTVSNKEDWLNLDRIRMLYEDNFKKEINWFHVPAHQGNPGNEKADILARTAAQRQLHSFHQYREESNSDDNSSESDSNYGWHL